MGNMKWYAIGAVGAVAFIMFLRKKNTSVTTGSAAADPTGTVTGQSQSTDSINALNQIGSELGQILQNQSALQTTTSTSAGSNVPAGKTGTDSNATFGPSPVTSPSHPYGSVWGTPDPKWAIGKGEWLLSTPDIYGGGQGAGVNEIATYLHNQGWAGNVNDTQLRQELVDWNSGQHFFKPGEQVYIGSFTGGIGH